MGDEVALEPFLVLDREGARHVEHGVTTVDADGRPARGPGAPGGSTESGAGAVRWDYDAPELCGWCGCGWTGWRHGQAQPTHRRVVGDGRHRDEWARAHRGVLREIEAEWSAHVHEAVPTLSVLVVMERVRAVEAELTEAVVAARRRRASWGDIATATEMKRQSAHERWRAVDPLPREQRSQGGRPPAVPVAASASAASVQAAAEVGTGAESSEGASGEGHRRPSPGRAVRRLAGALVERTGVEVHPEWTGPRSRDGERRRWGGWVLSWAGGPTRAEMRELAAELAGQRPELAGADEAVVTWWRGLDDLDAAASHLAWLEAHPADGATLAHVGEDALPGWPDRLPWQTRERAHTLVAAGWRPHTAGATAERLHQLATEGGPDVVAAWLDQLAEASTTGPVVDLAARRRASDR